MTSALKELYREKLLPLEEHYRFGAFHSPALEDADFDGKPMVLVAGQYSTGKTSFIQYLLEQEVPGSRVGPEPTTDCFVAVMHGETEGTVPGNALVVDPDKPFRKLNPFGNTFLNRCAAWSQKCAVSSHLCLYFSPFQPPFPSLHWVLPLPAFSRGAVKPGEPGLTSSLAGRPWANDLTSLFLSYPHSENGDSHSRYSVVLV